MRRFHVIVCAGLFAMMPAGAVAAKDPHVYSVHVIDVQQCGYPVTVAFSAHPEQAEIMRTGRMVLGKTGYGVDFTRIADYRDWSVKQRLGDTSRGIEDHYLLFTGEGSRDDGAYVVSALPDQAGDRERMLELAWAFQERQVGTGKASFIRTDTPFGEGLEMVVGGRIGSYCFPTSPFQYAGSPADASIGISRFTVDGIHLIEYTLTMPWPQDVPQDAMVERAQRRMDVFQRGLVRASELGGH